MSEAAEIVDVTITFSDGEQVVMSHAYEFTALGAGEITSVSETYGLSVAGRK